MKHSLIASLALALIALAACADDAHDIGDRDPDIRGEITDVGLDGGGDVVSVFVQGESNSYFLRVDDDTDVFRIEDGERVAASREDLDYGQRVEAWVVGAINPSEPPQGNAGQIVITGDLPENPSIRGEITTVSFADGEVSSILVEGEVEPDTEFDKASLRVDENTAVYRLKGGERVEASREDLAEGHQVEAWIVGAVAESYPVQGYAGRIVILDAFAGD